MNTMAIGQQVTSSTEVNSALMRSCFQRPSTHFTKARSKCSSNSRSPVQLHRASSMAAPCASLVLYEACF